MSSLNAFGVESHTPGDTAVAQSATIVEPPEDLDMGPWEAADTEFGVKTRRLSGSTRTPSGPRAEPYHVRWVVGGDLVEYVDEHGEDEVFTIPSTYDGMSNGTLSPVVETVDSLAPGDKTYGWGINGKAIERAFRTLSGGGRYTASQWRVLPCGEYPWVLTGPGGTALCGLVPVRRPGEEVRTTKVDGPGPTLDVEEQNRRVLAGIRRFRQLLDSQGITLVEHACPVVAAHHTGAHVFESADRETHRIKPQTLATLAQLETDPEEVAPSKGYFRTGPHGRKREIKQAWSGPDHDIGTMIDDRLLAGFQFGWDNPENTNDTVATVEIYWLEDGYSRWKLTRRTDRLTTFIR